MSDADNFLTRWSRRKRAAEQESAPDNAAAASERAAGDDATSAAPPDAGGDESAFDLSALPSIDSITADTDIRAFFTPGVPVELTREALRRAWVADPAIRDFIGLAENSGDFNAPGAMPGFGPLEMTDSLRREIARMVGGLGSDTGDAAAALEPATPGAAGDPAPQLASPDQAVGAEASSAAGDPATGCEVPESAPVSVRRNIDRAALQQERPARKDLQEFARRGHGRALPE